MSVKLFIKWWEGHKYSEVTCHDIGMWLLAVAVNFIRQITITTPLFTNV
jgi:hypothetical protein